MTVRSGPFACFASDEHFHVVVWTGVATVHAVALAGTELTDFLKATHGPRAVVNIIGGKAAPPPKEGRIAIAGLDEQASQAGATNCVLLSSSGFAATIQRSVIAGVALFTRKADPVLVAKDVDELLPKLRPELQQHAAALRALVDAAHAEAKRRKVA